ncbi:hypothetical protein JXM67_09000 [candidate division WOR-3 bacterium]|nr:hypothetical protein [candidate division WOR-3 bacterium]
MKKEGLRDTLLGVRLPASVELFLRDTNPWWYDEAMKPVPPFRRWLFNDIVKRIKGGLAPVTVLRGPRQVGKTTLQ